MFETLVTAGGFSALLLQGIKWLWRKFVAKNMLYEFPAWFYALSVPVLNILVVPVLAFIGFTGFAFPTDWVGWAQGIVQVLIGTAISFFTYNDVIKPFNTYRATLKDGNA